MSQTLLKISCVLLFIGLSVLILLSSLMEPDTINISKINKNMLDEYVKIRGNVSDVKVLKTNFGKITKFIISDSTESISVIFYKEVNLSEEVEVVGRVRFEEKLQIEAKKIKNL